jgi:peptidoglycan hydrolase-like protein with peptidoglycan-binding domain
MSGSIATAFLSLLDLVEGAAGAAVNGDPVAELVTLQPNAFENNAGTHDGAKKISSTKLVTPLQNALTNLGFGLSRTKPHDTRVYGPQTTAAVREFQREASMLTQLDGTGQPLDPSTVTRYTGPVDGVAHIETLREIGRWQTNGWTSSIRLTLTPRASAATPDVTFPTQADFIAHSAFSATQVTPWRTEQFDPWAAVMSSNEHPDLIGVQNSVYGGVLSVTMQHASVGAYFDALEWRKRVIVAVASNEAPTFEGINTYDAGIVSVGFQQWILGKLGGPDGEFPGLASILPSGQFTRLFGLFGLTVRRTQGALGAGILRGHFTLDGVQVRRALREEFRGARWAFRVGHVGRDLAFRRAEFRDAIARIDVVLRTGIPGANVPASVMLQTERLVALALDQHINLGHCAASLGEAWAGFRNPAIVPGWANNNQLARDGYASQVFHHLYAALPAAQQNATDAALTAQANAAAALCAWGPDPADAASVAGATNNIFIAANQLQRNDPAGHPRALTAYELQNAMTAFEALYVFRRLSSGLVDRKVRTDRLMGGNVVFITALGTVPGNFPAGNAVPLINVGQPAAAPDTAGDGDPLTAQIGLEPSDYDSPSTDAAGTLRPVPAGQMGPPQQLVASRLIRPMQAALAGFGFPVSVDAAGAPSGKYDTETQDAVREFQRAASSRLRMSGGALVDWGDDSLLPNPHPNVANPNLPFQPYTGPVDGIASLETLCEMWVWREKGYIAADRVIVTVSGTAHEIPAPNAAVIGGTLSATSTRPSTATASVDVGTVEQRGTTAAPTYFIRNRSSGTALHIVLFGNDGAKFAGAAWEKAVLLTVALQMQTDFANPTVGPDVPIFESYRIDDGGAFYGGMLQWKLDPRASSPLPAVCARLSPIHYARLFATGGLELEDPDQLGQCGVAPGGMGRFVFDRADAADNAGAPYDRILNTFRWAARFHEASRDLAFRLAQWNYAVDELRAFLDEQTPFPTKGGLFRPAASRALLQSIELRAAAFEHFLIDVADFRRTFTEAIRAFHSPSVILDNWAVDPAIPPRRVDLIGSTAAWDSLTAAQKDQVRARILHDCTVFDEKAGGTWSQGVFNNKGAVAMTQDQLDLFRDLYMWRRAGTGTLTFANQRWANAGINGRWDDLQPSVPDRWSFTGPLLLSVTPNTGPRAGGTSVLIEGTGLAGVTHVRFSGVEARNLVHLADVDCKGRAVVSDTLIRCVTPAAAHAGPADVVLTAPVEGSDSTSAISGRDVFTYA